MDNRRPPKDNFPKSGRNYDRNSSAEPGHGRGLRRAEDGEPGNSEFGRPQRASQANRGPVRRPSGGANNPRYDPGNTRGRFNPRPAASRPKIDKRSELEIKITSDLQLTDGRFRGRLLGNSVSPGSLTMPRALRESMFRIMARRVRAGRFLDLCTGCGTIGIEAISRGAMLCTFVERSARSVTHLRKNLTDIGIKEGHFEIVEMEAVPYLNRCAARKRTWDIVFVSRTGNAGDAELIELVSRGRVIAPGGAAVIEHSTDQPMPATLGVLTKWRTIENERVSLSFYNRK